VLFAQLEEHPMAPQTAVGRSAATFDPEATLTVVVELSQAAWLVAALIPGVERRPLKKLLPNEEDLIALVKRWRDEAAAAGREIRRVVLGL
jgi:transposase